MPVPDYETLMRDILDISGAEQRVRDVVEPISEKYHLSPEERAIVIPSGGKTLIKSRIEWAITYLVHAGLLNRSRRGHFVITPRGMEVRSNPPHRLDAAYLKRFPEFIAFLTRHKDRTDKAQTFDEVTEVSSSNPEEAIGAAHEVLEREIKEELLKRIMLKTPEFFEGLIVSLLSTMGYGNEEALAQAVGRTGDGGIDGIIFQDRLGLDVVYLQAKRYDPSSTVGSPELQAFVGALAGRTATKGVFVTTSKFSRPALDYLKTIPHRVIVIDGEKLIELMIEYGVGVKIKHSFLLHRIDEDFFIEE